MRKWVCFYFRFIQKCVFPFKFNGVEHHECILVSVYIIPVIHISKNVEKKCKTYVISGRLLPTLVQHRDRRLIKIRIMISHHNDDHILCFKPKWFQNLFKKEEKRFFSFCGLKLPQFLCPYCFLTLTVSAKGEGKHIQGNYGDCSSNCPGSQKRNKDGAEKLSKGFH